MNNDLNTYYLKAVDAYPHNLEEVVENLNYAYSYNDEDANVHLLFGRLYHEQLRNYERAKHHYELAGLYDKTLIDFYNYYSNLLIETGKLYPAIKLISKAKFIPGVCNSCFLIKEALIYEIQGDFDIAIKTLNEAINKSIHNGEIDYIKKERRRVKSKLKAALKSK